jgi:hypothetical protein
MKKYRFVKDVPVDKDGAIIFLDSQAPLIAWWEAKPKKYYWVCKMHEKQDPDTDSVIYRLRKCKIIKVTAVFKGKYQNWFDTSLHLTELTEDGIVEKNRYSHDDDFSATYYKFWPMNDREIVVFKKAAILARNKIITDF